MLITSFTTFVLSGNELTGIKAFVTVSYMMFLRLPLGILPEAVIEIGKTMVSVKRIDKFLNVKELRDDMIEHEPFKTEAIVMKSGTFHWGDDDDDSTILENVDINLVKGSLTAVITNYYLDTTVDQRKDEYYILKRHHRSADPNV